MRPITVGVDAGKRAHQVAAYYCSSLSSVGHNALRLGDTVGGASGTGRSEHREMGNLEGELQYYDLAAGTVIGQGSFSVSRTGFEQLALFLHQHAPDQSEVLVGIEATGHYHVTLLEFLLERGYAVVLVNPYQAAQFRRSPGAKAKTDRIDVRALPASWRSAGSEPCPQRMRAWSACAS